MFKSLNQFIHIQRVLVRLRYIIFTRVWKMNIHESVIISLSARLDRTNPRGVHIARNTYIAFDVAVLTHDMVRGLQKDTFIGECCFIGARSIIMPGVSVGNNTVIASGSVVTKDIPANCIAAGNPAQVIKDNVKVYEYGRLVN